MENGKFTIKIDFDFDTMASIEQKIIEKFIAFCRGDKKSTAKKLGISRSGLYSKLARFEY